MSGYFCTGCYFCRGDKTPGEGDFCACGGIFVHARLDKRRPRACTECGRTPEVAGTWEDAHGDAG
jgi:hypothetical protein